MKIETDILVAGTGPAGLIAALAFNAAGFQTVLVGPAPNIDDARTSALMVPQLDFLDRLSLLDRIIKNAAPLKVMRIVDATQRLLRCPVVTFRASEIDENYFGLNIPNRYLMTALNNAIGGKPEIRRVDTLVKQWKTAPDHVEAQIDDERIVTAKLAVAADGRFSPAREAAGIKTRSTANNQSALVLNFAHTRNHNDISTEFHTEHGPFTQVPLPGRHSSLVWVTYPEHASALSKLDDEALSQAIEQRMQSMLGRITIDTKRQIYPLLSAMPKHFAQNRIALVGEAAHVFPPIGAQGLNLGIRDIEALIGIATGYVTDPGGREALSAYDRSRRPDIFARASAVNLLNRSLLSDMLPLQMLRSAGLGLLGSVPPLRTLFMREGLRTGTGIASLFRN